MPVMMSSLTDVSALANGTVYGGTGTDTLLLEEVQLLEMQFLLEPTASRKSSTRTAITTLQLVNAEATGITEATVDGTTEI